MAKKKFPGRVLIFNMIVLSLMFNATVTRIPTYIIMAKVGWIDSHLSLIIPAFGSSLGLYLMKQFMGQINHSRHYHMLMIRIIVIII